MLRKLDGTVLTIEVYSRKLTWNVPKLDLSHLITSYHPYFAGKVSESDSAALLHLLQGLFMIVLSSKDVLYPAISQNRADLDMTAVMNF